MSAGTLSVVIPRDEFDAAEATASNKTWPRANFGFDTGIRKWHLRAAADVYTDLAERRGPWRNPNGD